MRLLMKTRICCILLSLLAACITGAGLWAMYRAVQPETAEQNVVLRLATCTNEHHPNTETAHYFAQLVQQKTNGQVHIQVIGNGDLGDEKASVEQLEFGGIAFSLVNCFALSDEGLAVNENGLKPNREKLNANRVEVLATLAPDKRGLASGEAMPQTISARKEIRIGAYPSKILWNTLQSLGFSVLSSSGEDMIGSIHYGYVDSIELPLLTYATEAYAQALPVLSLYDGPISPDILLVSQVSLGNLPTEQQQIIRECALEAAEYQQRILKQKQEESLSKLRKQGVRVLELDRAGKDQKG